MSRRVVSGSSDTNDAGNKHSIITCEFCERLYCELHQSGTCPHKFYDDEE